MPGRVAVEIAVQDIAGVLVAAAGGADRVELCSALGMGGLTPSAALVRGAVAAASRVGREAFVHVLVRPRGGGFVYNRSELEVAAGDVRFARESGAAGVVIGALDESGRVDIPAIERLVAEAGPLEVTYHRALDVVTDPIGAAEVLTSLGVTRILTSGGAARCIDGAARLRSLAERLHGRMQVMAGGGVRVEDVPALIATGIHAVHLSARDTATGAPSGPGGGDAAYDITDPVTVRSAVAAARFAHRRPDQSG